MANEQSKAFIDQATQSLQGGNFQQALDLVEQAIAIDPKNSDAHVLKGICQSQLAQPEVANETFRKAIMLSPYNAKAYYNFAVHKNALGEKKEALELAREAASVDPRHTAARQFYSQLGDELAGQQVVAGGPAQVAPENPHDPLAPPSSSPPPSSSAPPVGDLPPVTPSGGVLPPPTPPAQSRPTESSLPPSQRPPGSPSTPSGNPYEQQANYARPGYDAYEHSLPWVGNMAKAWTIMGWCFWGLIIVSIALVMILSAGAVAQAASAAQPGGAGAGFGDGYAIGQRLGSGMAPLLWIGWITTFVWLVIDFIDRRASVGWVLGTIAGFCCCFGTLGPLIYLAAGRKRID